MDAVATRTEAAAPACANCGAAVEGHTCAACGQKVLPRLTVRMLLTGLIGWALDTEGSVLRTGRGLLARPGAVLGDILRGRTLPYAGPFAFVALGLAAAGLTIWATGDNLGHDSWIPGILTPFFLAAAGRLVFPRGRLNFAEHLVANLYLIGADSFLFVPAWLLPFAVPRALATWVFGGALAAIVGFHVRGLARLQGGGWRGWLGGLATAALALAGEAVFLLYYVRIVKALLGN